jgi:hypothetical protein
MHRLLSIYAVSDLASNLVVSLGGDIVILFVWSDPYYLQYFVDSIDMRSLHISSLWCFGVERLTDVSCVEIFYWDSDFFASAVAHSSMGHELTNMNLVPVNYMYVDFIYMCRVPVALYSLILCSLNFVIENSISFLFPAGFSFQSVPICTSILKCSMQWLVCFCSGAKELKKYKPNRSVPRSLPFLSNLGLEFFFTRNLPKRNLKLNFFFDFKFQSCDSHVPICMLWLWLSCRRAAILFTNGICSDGLLFLLEMKSVTLDMCLCFLCGSFCTMTRTRCGQRAAV